MTLQPSPTVTAMAGRENTNVKIARLEETLLAVRDDVSDIKAMVGAYDRRIAMIEDVRVRALEDWRIQDKAVRDERGRAADAAQAAADAAQAAAERAADQATAHTRSRIGRVQFWVGVFVTALVTILGALIASGHLL
jgi:hypothetical protein